jgi:hypothetical protein
MIGISKCSHTKSLRIYKFYDDWHFRNHWSSRSNGAKINKTERNKMDGTIPFVSGSVTCYISVGRAPTVAFTESGTYYTYYI